MPKYYSRRDYLPVSVPAVWDTKQLPLKYSSSMNVQMLRRRRSEEGRLIRSRMMREGKGDHCGFRYKQMYIDCRCPWSSALTTFITKDNLLIEIYENT